MGWVSLGIGAAELLAARAVAGALGAKGQAGALRLVGLRGIASGVGLLSGRAPREWIAARLAGDAMDLTALALLLTQRRARRGAVLATMAAAAVVGAVDAWCLTALARGAAHDARAEEQRLDESLDESYPASDPPAHHITGAEPPPTEVRAPGRGVQRGGYTH